MNQAVEWPSSVTAIGQDRKYLTWLLRALDASVPVVLVGSWARQQMQRDQSDVDILVLGDDDRTRVLPPHTPPDVQLIVLSEKDFERRLRQGDDFPQWALRFGVPVRNRRHWEELRRRLLDDAPWPDFQLKLEQALKKKSVAATLLDMGDLPAAAEETRYAVSHAARAILLSRHVFPLSRPELPEQLSALGATDLADCLRRINDLAPPTRRDLETAIHQVEEIAANLSRNQKMT
jgi:predicted nucleotidyltransferase